MTELSDELLVAYVDGQLARKQSSAVEKVLEQDDVIARRVEALKDAHFRLEAAFDSILAGEELEVAKPEPGRPGLFVPWATAVKVGLAGTGLVASLMLMIAGYGWSLSMPELSRTSSSVSDPEYTGSLAPSWQETAARAQGLLSRESLEVTLESQGNLDLVAFQLSQAIGPGLKLPNLDTQGYRFMRAQLLRADEEPLAQLLYLGTSGAPLSLYAKKGDESEAPAFKRYGGIGSVAWSEDGIAYLLAGEADEPALMRLAETIRSEPQDTEQGEGTKSGDATPPYSPLPRPLTASGAMP
jgi:anti-sigma factor RsiW